MQATWSVSCIKYLLFIFNLIFFITGIIICSLGVSIKTYFTSYDFVLEDQYFSIPNLLIAIGAIIFLISFYGCYGAIRESFCSIVFFSILLILIFVLEFAAGISGYVLRNQTFDFLSEKLQSSLHKYDPNNTSSPTTKFWDEIQTDFHCCGVHNYMDWKNVTNNDYLPMTCCGPQIGLIGIANCNTTTTTLFKAGCVSAFGKIVEDHALTIASSGLALAFIQFLGIVFSCYLAKQIKKSYETV
ncbi:hypothetical protein PPYR_12227 [Photinus pyralis]|uniref:Tetraspanin n=1 Tax=Photinus pyralis TaxID=7054 RepID=A0A1Y1MU82_PHOPY|nr:CD63 antigen [Photinus pyralis]KAB0795388.1 hypothetical protein PPYR_12227 [Photinus pyralis]